MAKKEFRPDFILCPYVLFEDENLKPMDRIIYGVIYWYEHLKDGICTASNKTIAEIAHCKQGSVTNSLNRLVKGGYIKVYLDNDYHRTAIRGMVYIQKRGDK